MKKIILFPLLLLIIWTSQVFADTWIGACENNFPPYNFIDKTGNQTGLDTELVQAVLDQLKINYQIRTYPWKTVVKFVDSNMVDFCYQFVGKPERFEKYWMVGPLRSGKTLFMVRKESPIENYNTLDDLKKYKIGQVIKYAYTPEYDNNNDLTKVSYANNEVLIQNLMGQNVDLAIGDLNTLSFIAKNLGVYEKIRFLPTVLKEVPRYVAFPKKRKEKADLFQNGLEEIKKNGVYDKIIQKWY